MRKQVLIAKFSKIKNRSDMQHNYIAMGHYDIIEFRIEDRNDSLVLFTGDRCFLPLVDDIDINPIGSSTFRFLTMINVLCWDRHIDQKITDVLRKLTAYTNSHTSNGLICSLFRSLDSCDIACLIDSNDYVAALSFIKTCLDSIENEDVYFFTVPMLNANMLSIKNDDVAHSRSNTVPNTTLQIRATVKSNRKSNSLLNINKLFKGFSTAKSRMMFGASDIVIDLGEYCPQKLIAYYRNIVENFEDYCDVLFSAEVEIMSESSLLQSNPTRLYKRIDSNVDYDFSCFYQGIQMLTERDSPLQIALRSLMASLLDLEKSGFFPNICYNAIPALIELINVALKKQRTSYLSNIEKKAVQKGLADFVEALSITLQSYLYIDSPMLEFLSTNAEVYGVRNKLALEYDRFILNCIDVLEKNKKEHTKYLFKPSLSSSVSVTRIWPENPPICIINIPTRLMLNSPKRLLFMISHEVSHYAGRDYRLCEERNSFVERLCTMVFTEYAINYFNSQIGFDKVSDSVAIKKYRIKGILNSIRRNRADCNPDLFYSAFCAELTQKYSDIIESADFIDAFDKGISASKMLLKDVAHSYSGDFDRDYSVFNGFFLDKNIDYSNELYKRELRRSIVVLQRFFMQIVKECIADLIAVTVLSIDNIQYNLLMQIDDVKSGDINSLLMLLRIQIVTSVLENEYDLCDGRKEIIDAFIISYNEKDTFDIEDKMETIVIDFIRYFINKGRLKFVIQFLHKVLLYSKNNIDPGNACKKQFDLIKESGHSNDYYASIM